MRSIALFAATTLAIAASSSSAQVVGVAIDPKAVLVHGDARAIPSPPPDSAVFFLFSGAKTQNLGRVLVPTSFIGPPSAVAISADRTLALVSSAARIDPTHPGEFAPDKKLSVIDLSAKPIRVTQTLELPDSPASIAMNRVGTLALALHEDTDRISVMSVDHDKVSVLKTLQFDKGSGPIAAAFNADGSRVLVTFGKSEKIDLFAVNGHDLKMPALHEMSAGVFPASLSYCGTTGLAIVANYGKVTGDADTISLIDVSTDSPRVVDTASVGPSPEGVACSPDGRYAAAAAQNMSTADPSNPLYSPHSVLTVLQIEHKRFHYVASMPFGGWAQGVGFLDDSLTLFAQSLADHSMYMFRIDGGALVPTGKPIHFSDGGPVAYGISGR
jgi:DNA-binding beta-propeller fold protein YncE